MNTQRHPSHSPDDQVWLYPVIFVLGLCVLHWIGANLASLLTHRGWVLSGTDTALAILKLGPHFRSPALAYPTDVQANVAGPVWYWTCVGLVFVVVIVAAAMIGVRVTGSRTEAVNRRRRLGESHWECWRRFVPKVDGVEDLVRVDRSSRRPSHQHLLTLISCVNMC